ncbi:MAG: pyruvate carboxylase [Bacteroidota bacterium]
MDKTVKKPRKLLVANRGEIAIRILRAAEELLIRTVAIYTYEDRYSLHRYKADEAYQIGKPDEPLRPYLDIEAIITLAKHTGVDAIHPGYGFLSENVEMARRCAEEGIIFVGPRAEVMEALGDKVEAKKIARLAEVPVIEDSRVPLDNFEIARAEAERIGYPVMIKAAAGGGGRGMRAVQTPDLLERAYNDARNEAKKAFGNDTVFFEKLVVNPKHIEVQILGDNYGNIVHLFERDCSVQRRFQKVVEIAPAPGLDDETREKLYAYALRICRQVGYNNAGTVEFLVDKDHNIFFIEVNPRIQVEHTITEEITRIDIVRSQILIASGYALADPVIFITKQEDVRKRGFAIQCRITTEDPENNFRPDTGTVIAYRNATGFGIRLDEGSCFAGARISPFFDSMLVKVSATGRTLKGTVQRLHRALREFRIRGVKTNIGFLENVISHPDFLAGTCTVKFIDDNPDLFRIPDRQDRGTRLLRYLADVTVNGNPDVGNKPVPKNLRKPLVPEYDFYTPPPPGSRQKLIELGPEAFAKQLRSDPKIQYTDTTLRDAHQSLLATRMRTYDMKSISESFARHHPQTFSMEVWGGATFDVALRFLHEDPWQRLQILRAAMPNILLQMLLRGSNAVGYKAYPDNLVEDFIENAWKKGIDLFRIFDSLNWLEEMKTSIRTVRERTNALAEACICYTGDMLAPDQEKYTLQYYLDLARRLEDEGAHIICIKDMAGLLKPNAAEVLVTSLRETLSAPVHLHTHDTAGIQAATYLKAIEAGVDVIDVAIGGMSGLTSQPNFNSIAAMMQGHAREQPYNLHSLNQFSSYWEDIREQYAPFESGLKAGNASVYEHEIPGGQFSNLRPQAESLGLGDRFQEIIDNYARANKMFGDVIKVTPTSKTVGDMALFMTANNLSPEDIMARGDKLNFPESVRSFFKGETGQPFGGFPKELQKIVLKSEEPFSDRPNAHLAPAKQEEEFAAFCKAFPHRPVYTDYLSYRLYPKVYEEFYAFNRQFGDVEVLPSPAFFYGMADDTEIMADIAPGKTLIIRKMTSSREPDESGLRTVTFEMNGQMRRIRVLDLNSKVVIPQNRKAAAKGEIGSPLQGRVSAVYVKPGQQVLDNAPLFSIEAMKMETTVTASFSGKVTEIMLPAGTLTNQDDLVLVMAAD